MIREILRKEILENFPRVLSILNRNPMDELCGSFDREYWAWNFKDYPNLSLQSGIFLLSLLWNTQFSGNVYYKDEQILESIKKSLFFWVRNQKKNGSFDQCYFNEKSFGTTAYTAISVLKSYPIIENMLTDTEKKAVTMALRRASDFLLCHSETYGTISNHQALFMYAYLLLKNFFGDERFQKKFDDIWSWLRSFQHEEGWFPEYEGADIGYLSQTIYYLALCYKATGDINICEAIKKAIEFYSYFIHPDGSVGGVYGSRYNESFYPAGFAVMLGEIPITGKILGFCIRDDNQQISLNRLDNENLIRLMTNYMEAITDPQPYIIEERKIKLPCEEDKVDKLFKGAAFYIKGDENFYSIVSVKKGGSMVVYSKDERKPLIIDPGYMLSLPGGVKISNGVFQNSEFKIVGDLLSLKAYFYRVSIPLLSPFKGLLLRILGFTLLRIDFINDWFKKFLVKNLIMSRKKSPATIEREVRFGREIAIKDNISFNSDIGSYHLVEDSEIRTYKMASVGYHFKPFRKIKVEKTQTANGLTINKTINVQDR